MTIGIAGDKDASEHEFAPETFNGWPLFGGGNAGRVPMAGPDDNTPIEIGIDFTSLLKDLGSDQDGKGRFFLRLSRADGSDAVGELHECAIRSYGPKGGLVRELKLDIENGRFGESQFTIETIIGGLERK